VSTGGPDLFVVCKKCGSEVSPYITECPYCGSRLRKRAPKLDRDGRPREPLRRPPTRLSRLRPGEIPGVRGDSHPWGTAGLVLGMLALSLVWQAGAVSYAHLAFPGLTDDWWRVLTANFVHLQTGYLVVTGGAVALFGWLLERRYGHVVPVMVFLIGGSLGYAAVDAVETIPVASGANGAALALLGAWVVPDLLARRHGFETESDLLGTAVIALVLILLPVVVPDADPLVGLVGGLAGLLLGLMLTRLGRLSRRD
jgi:membrane associated rhomboid family serine protease